MQLGRWNGRGNGHPGEGGGAAATAANRRLWPVGDQGEAAHLGQQLAHVVRVDHPVLHVVPHVEMHVGRVAVALRE